MAMPKKPEFAAPLDPVELLQHLIRIASVNPLGHEGGGPIYGEARLTDFLQSLCEELGWGWLRQRVHTGRENLLTMIPGAPLPREGGELLLWDVHQDTVAVDGMTVEPFGGEVRDGRVYGRGAVDDKGPMAAMIAALSRLTPLAAGERRPTIVLAFTVNEECGFSGARALCHLWAPVGTPLPAGEMGIAGGTLTPVDLFPRRPDAVLVAEPTDLNVVVAHQGVVRWRCHTEGLAAHSSRPDEGVNAIYAMTGVLRAVEQFQAELTASGREHPLCGRPAACVTTINGGVGINTVPDRATISIDRRITPGDDPQTAFEEMVDYIAARVELGRARLVHDPPFMQSQGLSDATNRPIAERVAGFVRQAGFASSLVGAPYGTDAAVYATAGVPAVVFGPGSVQQAHTADEYIEVSALEPAVAILERVTREGLRG
jgi:acetylornithine deacetylase/succinyl-diaminopimelate desuccinylase-like protein